MNAIRTIAQEVLEYLSIGVCKGNLFFLPNEQLDRSMYQMVDKVLQSLGGKWNWQAKAHRFEGDAGPIIETAIETGTYVKPSDMGWFPTPPLLALELVRIAGVEPNMEVLEPSAADGAIAIAIHGAGGIPFCVEIDPARGAKLMMLMDEMGRPREHVLVGDFMGFTGDMRFDRIVMNPPFAKRADIDHVMHARQFLKPDGLLVSVMSGGILFREDLLTKAFRPECRTIEKLPDGSFYSSGTDVRTCVITMKAAP